MSTRILYAGRASHAAVFADDPQPRDRRARLDWAVRHAVEDARHFGDVVSEIVSINDRTLSNNDFAYCRDAARREFAPCGC